MDLTICFFCINFAKCSIINFRIMKKVLILALALMMGGVSATMSAQTKEYTKQQKAFEKEAEKTAKKQAKELKKQKWEYTGVLPLEMALKNFYLETTDFGGTKQGIEHEVVAQTVSAGEKALLLNAQSIYAQEVQAMLGADLANSTNSDNERAFEEYIARVAAKVKHEFQGDIRRVILLKKRTDNGKQWTLRAYFIVDADSGRLRAKRIAEEVERNNGAIDSIHDKVFGEEK